MASFGAGIVCLMLIAYLASPAMSATYTVGDAGGWALGVDYSTWASDKTLKVGDSLVFNYGSSHSVSEVSASDYKSCSTGNALNSDNSGATTITLKTPGKHYFVCGVPGHCDGGMKVEVTVTGAAATPTPGATASPETPAISTTPPASTNSNGVPHPPSSAGSLSPFLGVFLASFAIMMSKMILL